MKTTIYDYFVLTNRSTNQRVEFSFTDTIYSVIKYINEKMSYDESYDWHVSLVTLDPQIEVKLCQAFVFHGNTTFYGRTENA